MKILVTGCMGFIGSNLVSHLLSLDHEVIGFDNLSKTSILPTERIKKASGDKWKNFKFYHADVKEFFHMRSILVHHDIDAIIHLAAVGSVPFSFKHPEITYSNNIFGFTNILKIAEEFGVNNFVFASSSSVYGDNDKPVKKEAETGLPLSPYALSKLTNEIHAFVMKNDLTKIIGLRFFNVYGPGQRFDGSYAAVIPKFLTVENPVIFGDGSTVRDFTYVEDACRAVEKALGAKGSWFINVGTGVGTSILELAEKCGIKDKVRFEAPRREAKTSIADIELAKKNLAWKPLVTLDEGLEITRAFYDNLTC